MSAVLEQVDPAVVEDVPLYNLRLDGGTQLRQAMDGGTVADYVDAIDRLPPGVVFRDDDGNNWLADGFHTRAAYARLKRPAMPCSVRPGTRRDAILYACGANAAHGLKRSDADKRNAVFMMLDDDEWSKWNDCQIARQCAVSHQFVHKLRRERGCNIAPPPVMNFDPPDEVTDSEGQPIPSNLREVFDEQILSTAARQIESLLPAIEDARKWCVWLDPVPKKGASGAPTSALMKQIFDRLDAARPVAVCPRCRGAGCPQCRSSGFLPGWMVRQLKFTGAWPQVEAADAP